MTDANRQEELPTSDLTETTLVNDIILPTELESYCVSCGENGITRFLRQTIPFFKDVILAAFECPECGFRSSDLHTVEYAERGCFYELKVQKPEDFDREVIRTEWAKIVIPEMDFEIPGNAGRKGEITTIEGILTHIKSMLEESQPLRRIQAPEVATQIDGFIERIDKLIERNTPFTLILDDPTGNSFIQNPSAPYVDPLLTVKSYQRTYEQNKALGLPVPDQNVPTNDQNHPNVHVGSIVDPSMTAALESQVMKVADPDNIVEIPLECGMCHHEGVLRTISATIPLFKEIVLMAFTCDSCGYRNSEVKPGGDVSDKGKIYRLRVTRPEDLNRDVLKSDSSFLLIPEIGFQVTTGTLGGCFTTVEGLLQKVREHLSVTTVHGDSKEDSETLPMVEFLDKIDKMSRLETGPFTFVINDALSNSYIQNLFYPEPDPYLSIEEYERTDEQNDELGLNDMNTEDYLKDIE
ncbi:putative Zinc finger protein ZPR1 like protein [Blattamonas nauphoetae]|uniref:Zinc finger protein ZPR1 like protein n=1 Tax=Blattamonas nauphoetae TaxID=2049346 RepID=A0ABQ9Y6F8_9EUKA|nr:putative Zinc finger protein ZPR1 like protein [Blattamonas nauphoetae]